MNKNDDDIADIVSVSVSSRSYILSYFNRRKYIKEIKLALKFPSPLGVIFSLIYIATDDMIKGIGRFPSPLGVIFSLIKTCFRVLNKLHNLGFRLLSELYSLLSEERNYYK